MINHNNIFPMRPLSQTKTADDLDMLVKETVAEWKNRTASWKLKQTSGRQLRREALKTRN